MKRIFKTRTFQRWMRKTHLTDIALCQAVEEMANGLIDADLGNGLVKKRVALSGKGKRGGLRVLLATNREGRWVFIFGFAKKDRDNVTKTEIEALRGITSSVLAWTSDQLKTALTDGIFLEICHDEINQ